MANPIGVTGRLTCIAMVLAGVAVAPAQQAAKPFLRIISPANGAVVPPGQKLAVKVTGGGDFRGIRVLGEEGFVALITPSMGRPPWVVSGDISLDTDPGKVAILAIGTASDGNEVASDPVELDVEPAVMPPVTFTPSDLIIPVGFCVRLTTGAPSRCVGDLFVTGTYADGTQVNLNRSTSIHFTSQSPAIAAVNRDGSVLLGVSPGSTKIVAFGKYPVNVTVR